MVEAAKPVAATTLITVALSARRLHVRTGISRAWSAGNTLTLRNISKTYRFSGQRALRDLIAELACPGLFLHLLNLVGQVKVRRDEPVDAPVDFVKPRVLSIKARAERTLL